MNLLTEESTCSPTGVAHIAHAAVANTQHTLAVGTTDEYVEASAAEKHDAASRIEPAGVTQTDGVLAAALRYAAQGWQVIPLHSPRSSGCSCKSRKCHSVGKHPHTRNGLKDASTDPSQIRRWFKSWPDANLGIVTGAVSGLVVVDVDDKGERKGSDTLASLLAANGDAITTMIVRTGNGRHIYYQHPGGTLKNSAGQLGIGLDVRADRGYVVAAPSRHANGQTYAVEQDLDVEQLPAWLRNMIARPSSSCAIELVQPSGVPSPIVRGGRNNDLYKLACRLRGREGMEQRDLERVLMSYNVERCEEPLEIEEVLRIVASACKFPAQKGAEKSLRRQNENPLYWFKFEVRQWFSDQNINAMRDDQTGWYIRLLAFAWNKGGYLTSDMDRLWRLARASSRARFEKDCAIVLADFDWMVELDGNVVLKHRYMAAEYAITLEKWMKKVGGGEGRANMLSSAS